MTQAPTIDEGKLQAFMMKAVGDMGAAATCATIMLGEKLGLYRAMAGAGPITPAELAEQDQDERAAGAGVAQRPGGVAATSRTTPASMSCRAEHAMALADEDSPVFIAGAFEVLGAMWASDDKLAEGFRSGKGLGWKDQASAPLPGH